jgi:serine/threonine-protein kinase
MADEQLSPSSEIRATPAGFIAGPGALLANRYEILEYVGKGGMGVVYKAHDRTLDETVAIKILRQQPFDDPSTTQRFLAEIKLARRVTHRNVCRIHDYGEADPVRFISMQFVEGIELGQLVRRRGRLGADEAYDIALQLVDGLEAIHDQAIVHRDLKTSNVMIDRRGIALLMDFGIAKLWEGEAGTALTLSGQIIGTPQYMSPEQAQGQPLDPRSDIYAMGVILFELFTGVLPFEASNFAAMIYKKVHEPLQLHTGFGATLPDSLKPVIRKALATAAADRYPSTHELGAALRDARAQTPVAEPDTRSTIVARVRELRDATPDAAVPARSKAVASGSRRNWLMTGVTLAAVVLLSLVVRITLPFFRSPSGHAGPPTAETSTPPTVSVPGRDPSRGASSPAPPPTATGRSNAPPIQPSTAVSTSSTSPDRGTDGCEDGDAAACVALAQAAEATKDFERAANLYVKACNGKAAAGCTGLGVLYNRGSGVTRDPAQAALYYERGCKLGDMSGCNNLGTVYEFGSIGFRDPAEAARLYDRACSNGQMDGCANLALLLLGTQGAAPQEKSRARELLEKACAAGIARACSKVK